MYLDVTNETTYRYFGREELTRETLSMHIRIIRDNPPSNSDSSVYSLSCTSVLPRKLLIN
jgi:hypothetical protein